MTHLLRQ